jgi:hypothetical protein
MEQDIDDEKEFFNDIVNLTEYCTGAGIIKKDSDKIVEVILKNWKDNVRIAASRGLTKAYICIYESEARYDGIIPIDTFVRMTDEFRSKLESYKIDPVMERIKKKVRPFNVDVIVLDQDMIDTMSNKDKENIIRSEYNERKMKNIIGIILSWEKSN